MVLYMTVKEKQEKFQGTGGASYLMGLYLQKIRVSLKIQLSSVKQLESNLEKRSTHLELVYMG